MHIQSFHEENEKVNFRDETLRLPMRENYNYIEIRGTHQNLVLQDFTDKRRKAHISP